ncbi:MAG TPA: YgeY family selenium metabolism-linked hydrolase [Clostridia bacterium]|nr:YgeY family selenium metabolism-linked hydrolase [Clostridia bacterium]
MRKSLLEIAINEREVIVDEVFGIKREELAEKLKLAAASRAEECISFLKDIISIPSPSGQEKAVAERIVAEMKKVGFDEAFTDRAGNAVGRFGNGYTHILCDAHIDTVTPDKTWKHDPYSPRLEDGVLYGLGACDDKGPLASLVYGVRLMRDLGLSGDYTVWVVGAVSEEIGEGFGVKSFLEETGVKPAYAVISEASSLVPKRGHKGRAMLEVVIEGRSVHASTPELGENPIYKAVPIIDAISKMGPTLRGDEFIGKGTIVVTRVDCPSPSLNTIPSECVLYLDRRLTLGEDQKTIIEEVKGLKAVSETPGVSVRLMGFEQPCYTGLTLKGEEFFPAWAIPEDHPLVAATVLSVEIAMGRKVTPDKWDFCTDGAFTMGVAAIPTIGFGPGDGKYAHSPDDQIEVRQVIEAASVFAILPGILASRQ